MAPAVTGAAGATARAPWSKSACFASWRNGRRRATRRRSCDVARGLRSLGGGRWRAGVEPGGARWSPVEGRGGGVEGLRGWGLMMVLMVKWWVWFMYNYWWWLMALWGLEWSKCWWNGLFGDGHLDHLGLPWWLWGYQWYRCNWPCNAENWGQRRLATEWCPLIVLEWLITDIFN